MTDQQVLAGLAEIMEEITGLPASLLSPEKSFAEDLDIDSLTIVEIAIAAQDTFGAVIPDDHLKDLKTVQDVIDFVQRAAVTA